jgi:hypothetical protein
MRSKRKKLMIEVNKINQFFGIVYNGSEGPDGNMSL